MKWAAFVLAAALLVGAAPMAGAHGDAPGFQGSGTVAPGAFVAFEASVHWHRLVGTASSDSDEAPLVVEVYGPDDALYYVAGPGTQLRINALVECCRDATWSLHAFLVRNVGDVAATVDVELVLLHDDLAVVAHGAEGDGPWMTLTIVTLLAAVPAWRAHATTPPHPERGRRWLRIGWWTLGASWAIVLGFTLYGWTRYGGTPLEALRAGFAPMPMHGAFFNSFMLVMLALMAAWGVTLAAWVMSEHSGQPATAQGGRRLALAAAAGALAFGPLFGWAYGNWWLAWTLAFVPGAIVTASVMRRASLASAKA